MPHLFRGRLTICSSFSIPVVPFQAISPIIPPIVVRPAAFRNRLLGCGPLLMFLVSVIRARLHRRLCVVELPLVHGHHRRISVNNCSDSGRIVIELRDSC